MRPAVLALALMACAPNWTPEPVPPMTDHDGPGTPIGDACKRLREVGCPEGWPNRVGRTCFETLSVASQLLTVPSACLASAKSVDDARACGDANSIRVRCVQPTTSVRSSSL